jgi:apolipoprotein D and lipocalin family protein
MIQDSTNLVMMMRTARKMVMSAFVFSIAVFSSGCMGVPDGLTTVSEFELDRYLGTWYEVARLDHRFERGMSDVTANYSMRDDGGVSVVNRGFEEPKGEWTSANGK